MMSPDTSSVAAGRVASQTLRFASIWRRQASSGLTGRGGSGSTLSHVSTAATVRMEKAAARARKAKTGFGVVNPKQGYQTNRAFRAAEALSKAIWVAEALRYSSWVTPAHLHPPSPMSVYLPQGALSPTVSSVCPSQEPKKDNVLVTLRILICRL